MWYIGVNVIYITYLSLLIHSVFFIIDNIKSKTNFYPFFVSGFILILYFLVPICIGDTLVTEDFKINYNGISDKQIYYILITLCMINRSSLKEDSMSFNKKNILSIISFIFSRKIFVVILMLMLFSYLIIIIFNLMGFNPIYENMIGIMLTVLTLYSLTTPLIQIVLLYFKNCFITIVI